jgi:anti-sigma regulatory factor (Ser/Thr protein kinase)
MTATARAHRPYPESAGCDKDDDVTKTTVHAATTYAGTFPGQASQAARVRHEITAYLDHCPAAPDMSLIASELAANAIIHTRSRGSTFQVRCRLSAQAARIEVEDLGGPWRPRPPSDRPHGLDIVQALTGEHGWGTRPAATGGRIVWAELTW